jgi:integrase
MTDTDAPETFIPSTLPAEALSRPIQAGTDAAPEGRPGSVPLPGPLFPRTGAPVGPTQALVRFIRSETFLQTGDPMTDLLDRGLVDERIEAMVLGLAPSSKRALAWATAIWTDWCIAHDQTSAPGSARTVATFIRAVRDDYKPSALNSLLWGISKLHTVQGYQDPTKDELVVQTLKSIRRETGTRQTQRKPVTWEERCRMIDAARQAMDGPFATDDVRERRKAYLTGLRDSALLALGYDTLMRRSELAALDYEHIQFSSAEGIDGELAGDAVVLIPFSKTDQEGKGEDAYVRPETAAMLRTWLTEAGIEKGPVFRGIDRWGNSGKRLAGNDVYVLFRKLALAAGIDPSGIGGHSTRVGACQDIVANGSTQLEAQRAGRWKQPNMVARYAERLEIRRGAMAKLAKAQRKGPQPD